MATTKLVITVPQGGKIASPENGNITSVYLALLNAMATRINDLEARLTALGG